MVEPMSDELALFERNIPENGWRLRDVTTTGHPAHGELRLRCFHERGRWSVDAHMRVADDGSDPNQLAAVLWSVFGHEDDFHLSDLIGWCALAGVHAFWTTKQSVYGLF